MSKPQNERFLIGGGTFVMFLLVWELCADFGAINPLFISSPSRIAHAGTMLMADPDFWNDVRISAREFIFGYVSAIVIGVPLGLFIGTSRRLSYIVAPFVDTLNAVPRVTLLPLLIIWFGIGIWSKVAVVFLGAVIPIVISALSGVKTSEARFLAMARSFSASRATRSPSRRNTAARCCGVLVRQGPRSNAARAAATAAATWSAQASGTSAQGCCV